VPATPGDRQGLVLPLPPPPFSACSCPSCLGPTTTPFGRCWLCRRLGPTTLAGDAPLVVVACYRPGDTTHAVLRGYKDAAGDVTRRWLSRRLAAAVGHFVDRHRRCLEQLTGPIDTLCTVPPRVRRHGGARRSPTELPALLDLLAAGVPAWSSLWPLRLANGTEPLGHLRVTSAAYRPTEDLTGRRVLLVDDTWTTGVHLRSAARTVEANGGHIGAIIALGRAVDPGKSASGARWWRHARRAALGAGIFDAAATTDAGCRWPGCPVLAGPWWRTATRPPQAERRLTPGASSRRPAPASTCATAP